MDNAVVCNIDYILLVHLVCNNSENVRYFRPLILHMKKNSFFCSCSGLYLGSLSELSHVFLKDTLSHMAICLTDLPKVFSLQCLTFCAEHPVCAGET